MKSKNDTGILCAQKDLHAEDVLYMEDELEDFKSCMTENYVNTQLIRSGFKPYFCRNDKGKREIDFIISIDGKLIPVEVKSGEHVISASLNKYMHLFSPV